MPRDSCETAPKVVSAVSLVYFRKAEKKVVASRAVGRVPFEGAGLDLLSSDFAETSP